MQFKMCKTKPPTIKVPPAPNYAIPLPENRENGGGGVNNLHDSRYCSNSGYWRCGMAMLPRASRQQAAPVEQTNCAVIARTGGKQLLF